MWSCDEHCKMASEISARTSKYTNEVREMALIWTVVSASIPPECVSVVGFTMQGSKLLCTC